ncbi:hypothetical protein SSCH_120011 [Syntrophaceticus schinkii]|uniref:Uncharacterized protein n=1 Tax=Syntrophaceticus schinkii TaxID=499207 RepID=A0A0B7MI98_9FIRM|nr:hypothetical protein SSCH_120011 [Syntrophaceticus schinkii]
MNQGGGIKGTQSGVKSAKLGLDTVICGFICCDTYDILLCSAEINNYSHSLPVLLIQKLIKDRQSVTKGPSPRHAFFTTNH